MKMLDVVRTAWNWTGLDPAEVVATNAFGNLIVRARDGAIWRICPEELSCQAIAANDEEYQALLADEEFRIDWEMRALVKLAYETLGPLEPDRCYCLKMPSVLGGAYEAENLGTNSRLELVSFAGDIGEQIKDVPDGGRVEIRVVT